MSRGAADRRALVTLGVVLLLAVAGSWLVAAKARDLRALRAQLAAQMRSGAPLLAAETGPITDEERRLWTQLEERLHRRYPGEAELPRAMVAVAEWARASGMELLSLDVQAPPGVPGAPLPPELALNGPRFKLVVRHRYRDLVRFIDGLPRLSVYVALQSLDVRRTEDWLTTEVAFATLRWGA